MNKIILRENRQLIPRWHTSRKVLRLQFPSKQLSTEEPIDPEGFRLEESLSNWSKKRSIQNAIDLHARLKQTNFTKNPAFEDTLNFLKKKESLLTPTVRNIISSEIHYVDKNDTYSTDKPNVYRIINTLKKQVSLYPRDALTWMDLAFYYSVLGESEKANKSATTSYALSNSQQFLSRSYSRFLLNQDRIDEAIHVLKKTGLSKEHPLVTSALLSITKSFSTSTPNINAARKVLKNYNGHPSMLSDLAASLGTIEIENGAIKKGKLLLQKSLEHPSENSIAQYSWLHFKHGINLSNTNQILNNSLESKATAFYVNKQFKECRDALMELHSFQPFSESSLINAGYISSTALDDSQFIIDHSNNRIPRQQMSFGELNNLIVAKVQTNQTENLENDIELLKIKVEPDKYNTYGTFLATMGLFHMTNGELDSGSQSYKLALDLFKDNKDERSYAVAQLYFLEHLLRFNKSELDTSNTEQASQLLITITELAKKNKAYEIVEKAKSIKRKYLSKKILVLNTP